MGDVKNGEGVYGLRRAFVLAGAETLAMSLWKVDDAATQKLMVSFYTRLLAGEGRAEALREAQLEILHSENGKYAHPYYWAAFSVTGNTATLDGKPAVVKLPTFKKQPRGCGGCSTHSSEAGHVLLVLLALVCLRRRP